MHIYITLSLPLSLSIYIHLYLAEIWCFDLPELQHQPFVARGAAPTRTPRRPIPEPQRPKPNLEEA